MISKHDVKKPHKFPCEAFLRQFDIFVKCKMSNILLKIKHFDIFAASFSVMTISLRLFLMHSLFAKLMCIRMVFAPFLIGATEEKRVLNHPVIRAWYTKA